MLSTIGYAAVRTDPVTGKEYIDKISLEIAPLENAYTDIDVDVRIIAIDVTQRIVR